MEEFLSSVRTVHFILIAATAAIFAFALSPRDADEYYSAQLEALFVSKITDIYSIAGPKDPRGRPDTPESKEVKAMFVANGVQVTEDFEYMTPILVATLSESPTFVELARLSNDLTPARVLVPSSEEVGDIIKNLKEGDVRCLRDDRELVSCNPLVPGWILNRVEVGWYNEGAYVRLSHVDDFYSMPDHEWYIFLHFSNDQDLMVYSVQHKLYLTKKIGDITSSTHDLFRQAVNKSALILRARGDTRMLGRFLKPVQDWWCQKRLPNRNALIEQAAEKRRRATGAHSVAAMFEAVWEEHERVENIVDDYSAICFPGKNIRGLPHLDSVWWEIEGVPPKEAVLLLQKKMIESRQTINFGGVQVDERSVRIILPFACFAISLFLLSNLTILRQRNIERARDDSCDGYLDYPWMGLYSDFLSRFLTWLTIFAFPVIVPPYMLFQLSENLDYVFVCGMLLTLCTAVAAHKSMSIVRSLRLGRARLSRVPTR